MITSAVVQNRYKALATAFDGAIARGAVKRSTPFYEWAAGQLLLDAEDTGFVVDSLMDEDHSHLLQLVSTALEEAGDKRLIPALILNKDKQLVVIVVLQP